MLKDSSRASTSKRSGPSAGGGKKPAARNKPPPASKPGTKPGAQAPRNGRSHAEYPDPEPPPDRIWEDRAG